VGKRVSRRFGGREFAMASVLVLTTGILVVAGGTRGPSGAAAQTAAAGTGAGGPSVALPNGVKAACPAPTPGHSQCLALFGTRGDSRVALSALATTPAATWWGPSDLQQAYTLTQASANYGSGETVAIVDAYDDPNDALMFVKRASWHFLVSFLGC
jgi:hypothetical protein